MAAQGFAPDRTASDRSDRLVGIRDVQRVINRLGQFQIDSVNVVTRAHYLPLFSRLGPYDPTLLERAANNPPRRLFEYWGHAASLIDVRLQPLLRFRMAASGRPWKLVTDHPDLVAWVHAQVAARGPVSARQIEYAEERSRTHWGWNWSSVKTALEWLFDRGEVTSAGRNSQFERVYDLPERVLPPAIWSLPTPSLEESVLGLVRVAARALGVATERCLRDYFRLGADVTRSAVATLRDGGELVPVRVLGWSDRAYLWHEATVPRSAPAAALVSPFDSLVFERRRLETLFSFSYRIEIYVPPEKRVHGYYVYPFLLGDRFVARVDLKADRTSGVLRVNAAWLEPGEDSSEVAPPLVEELARMARWLGLADVQVQPRGTLGAALRSYRVWSLADSQQRHDEGEGADARRGSS